MSKDSGSETTEDWLESLVVKGMEKHPRYAWYSAKQHELFKYMVSNNMKDKDCNVYFDKDNVKIVCTEVTSTPEIPNSNFDDFVFLGRVYRWSHNDNYPVKYNMIRHVSDKEKDDELVIRGIAINSMRRFAGLDNTKQPGKEKLPDIKSNNRWNG